jgi:peptide/nickel transport system ATP-binding protein
MSAVLEVESLSTAIETSSGIVRPLAGVTLEIRPGETFALVGESGCGKSMTALTLMRILPETAAVTGGSVRLQGEELLALPESAMRDVRGRRMAMIFQEPATSLNPVLTVGRQIEEVLERHTPLGGAPARARAIELLRSVGIGDAERRLDEYPFQFSGGMKQRVMIALALAAEPALLVADEPTTALDVTIQAQVLGLLADLQRRMGMSILLITHDLGVVAGMAHRVAVMYAGEIVEIAPREAFFRAPQHPYSRKLFEALPEGGKRGAALSVIPGQVPSLDTTFVGCRFADRCESVVARCRTEAPGWTAISAGHAVRCHLRAADAAPARETAPRPVAPAAASAAGGPALLEVRDLAVHFPIRRGLFKRTVGHVRAVDGISFDIPAGRTLALVGESGCGKTTAGKALLQLVKPTAGSVRFEGRDLCAMGAAELRTRRKDVQIVFQDPFASLNPRMRVADILAEGMTALGVLADDAARRERVAQLLQQVGLPPQAAGRYPHEFSGGQRQRIAIARALSVEPRLIVCDEPTSALDVSVQAQILNLLKRLQAELGLAYLFITHNMAVVEYLADEVAVMYLGRIVESGTVAEVLRDAKHPYTRALLAAVPRLDGGDFGTVRVQGEQPSPIAPPSGCHFHPRCPEARDACRSGYPEEARLSATHGVRCTLYAGPSAPRGAAS